MGKVDKDHTINPDELLQAHAHEAMCDRYLRGICRTSKEDTSFSQRLEFGGKKRPRELLKGTSLKMPWDT